MTTLRINSNKKEYIPPISYNITTTSTYEKPLCTS